MAPLPDRIIPGTPRQSLPAVVFAHLLPGELRIVVHPAEGQGGAEWDISIDLVPPDLRVPNTLVWVEVDPEFKVCRVTKRAQDEDYKINTELFQRSVNDLAASQASADSVVPRKPITLIAIVWLLALACVVFARFRGKWPAYRSMHTWLDAQGVPGWLRNLDAQLPFILAAIVGAVIVHRVIARSRAGHGGGIRGEARSLLGMLGIQHGVRGWVLVVMLALAPMIIGGLVLGLSCGNIPAPMETVVPAVLDGVLRAAIQEELFFRGLLVGVVASAAIGWSGRAFWINASLAAALFGAMHIKWTLQGVAGGWPTFLMTFAGGLWFAWLLANWRNVWVPMILHAGMNLGWMLAAAEGGAGGGGLIVNLLRVATITIATWMTVRRTRRAAVE